jgi:hypothetical protein
MTDLLSSARGHVDFAIVMQTIPVHLQCSPTIPRAGQCFEHRKPGQHSTSRTQRVLDDPKPNDDWI